MVRSLNFVNIFALEQQQPKASQGEIIKVKTLEVPRTTFL